MIYNIITLHIPRRVATKIHWGEGGRINVSQNHLPPNSDSPRISPTLFKKFRKIQTFLVNSQNFFLKKLQFLGGHPPGILNRGDASLPSPWVATPMHIPKLI